MQKLKKILAVLFVVGAFITVSTMEYNDAVAVERYQNARN